MADGTSARIFASVFEHLAKNPTEENKKFAEELLDQTAIYDFNFYQMYCDDALITLELARRCGKCSSMLYAKEECEECLNR